MFQSMELPPGSPPCSDLPNPKPSSRDPADRQGTCQKRRTRFFGRSERVVQCSSLWIMCSNSRNSSCYVQELAKRLGTKKTRWCCFWWMIDCQWCTLFKLKNGEWMINDRTGIMTLYIRRGAYNYWIFTSINWDRTPTSMLIKYQ